MSDYLVTLSPKESYAKHWLVLGAPNMAAARDAIWAEKGYNSGESTKTVEVTDRTGVDRETKRVIVYDAAQVEAAKEFIQYND